MKILTKKINYIRMNSILKLILNVSSPLSGSLTSLSSSTRRSLSDSIIHQSHSSSSIYSNENNSNSNSNSPILSSDGPVYSDKVLLEKRIKVENEFTQSEEKY